MRKKLKTPCLSSAEDDDISFGPDAENKVKVFGMSGVLATILIGLASTSKV
jgi:hypothetical protein